MDGYLVAGSKGKNFETIENLFKGKKTSFTCEIWKNIYIYIKKNILRLLEKKKKKKIRNCVWFGKLLEKWEKLKTTRKSNCCGCFYKYLYEKNETFYVNNLRVLNILAIYQGRNGDYFAIAFKEIVCKKSRKKRRRGVSCWISIK